MRPLIKVVALASATNPDAALLSLQAEFAAADQAWEALYQEQMAAENAYFALTPGAPEAPMFDGDMLMDVLRGKATLSPEAAKAIDTYAEAMAAWRKATEQAELASGLKAAEEAVNAADRVRLAIRDRIVATRARTLSGLCFKAKYAVEHFPGDPDEEIMRSIVDDLCAMAGEIA